MAQVFDIAVLGATAAGYVAAGLLARKGRSVIVMEAPHQAAESPLADWVPKEYFAVAGLPKSLAEGCGATKFSSVHYHSADLARQVEYKSRGPIGYFLMAPKLTAALRAWAIKSGAKVKASSTRPAITLEEDQTRITGAAQATARLLIISHSRPDDVISDLSLPMQTAAPPAMVVAALDIPLPAKGKATIKDALHVVETHDRSDLGMYFATNGHLHIRLMSASAASGTRAAELSAMVAGLQKQGLLPADLSLSKARGAVWYPPAGMALEMETHVAKRCLLIGTAGGFSESITGQTLYPGARSAVIAAEVAQSALGLAKTQEDLMRFKTAWRKTLADYIRPPNTSLQMLLPLLFVNQQIVAKFTKALLLGENI